MRGDPSGPMDIDLREATSAESDFVFNVLREAIGPYVELAWGWDDARELEQHRERWGRQRVRVIVAGEADAGYVSTAVYEQPTGRYPSGLYLHQLMILPRFQSRGIGSACLRRVQAEARELGQPLQLRVFRINPRALAFYLAAGCRIVGESDSHISLQWSVDEAG
jgi:ribosomal protein S18 acetylase RimI-like enzyme